MTTLALDRLNRIAAAAVVGFTVGFVTGFSAILAILVQGAP